MFMFRAIVAGAVGLLGLLAALEAAAVYVRKTATDSSGGDRYVRILADGEDRRGKFIEFDARSFAAHPGPLSIRARNGVDLVRLGPGHDTIDSGLIRRYVQVGDTRELLAAGEGSLSGHLGETPDAFGFDYMSVDIEGFSAWVIPPDEEAPEQIWAIHVHGLGSSRSQVLRGVDVFRRQGITSLVPSYATSLENQTMPRRSHLGIREWTAIAAAQQYAIRVGARRIVYVGWSLGASIALRSAERASPVPVVGAALVSPALDWRNIILSGMGREGVPTWAARAVLSRFNHIFLRHSPTVRWENMPGSPDYRPPSFPLLITHGTSDRAVPIQLSRDLASRYGENAVLVEFDDAHHTLEWNVDPRLWESSVTKWLETLSTNCPQGNKATVGGESNAKCK